MWRISRPESERKMEIVCVCVCTHRGPCNRAWRSVRKTPRGPSPMNHVITETSVNLSTGPRKSLILMPPISTTCAATSFFRSRIFTSHPSAIWRLHGGCLHVAWGLWTSNGLTQPPCKRLPNGSMSQHSYPHRCGPTKGASRGSQKAPTNLHL